MVTSSKDAMTNGWHVEISREPLQSGNLTTLLYVATLRAEDNNAFDSGRVSSAIRLTSECDGKTYKSIVIATKSRAQISRALRLITEK